MLEITLYKRMADVDFERVRAAYIARARLEAGRVASAAMALEAEGFEQIAAPMGQLLTDDGREIVRVGGVAWARSPAAHARWLAAEVARRQAGNAVAPGRGAQRNERLADKTCPQITDGLVCGGSLQQSGICPRCDLGKQGYTYRYTCESCGYDVATREPL